MPSELFAALFKRRTRVDDDGQTFESSPELSCADASFVEGLSFDAPNAKQWLLQQKPPEEDRVAELLSDSLTKRGSLPAHAPRIGTEVDMLRHCETLVQTLEKAKLDLQSQQCQLEEDQEQSKIVTKELELRMAEVAKHELALEEERQRLHQQEEARKNYPLPPWLEQIQGTANVAVVGDSGVGKSLLINKLRRLEPGDDHWAPVGVSETTMEPTMYRFPNVEKIRLWDLPGGGTEAFPRNTYIATMGLRYFDAVIVVSAHRFTSTEVELAKELAQHSVPFFMARTKVDMDVWNNMQDNRVSEEDTVRHIEEDLKNRGVERPYLISSRDPDKHDLHNLLRDVFPVLKQLVDPNSNNDAWNDPWAMPPSNSLLLSGLQGQWCNLSRAERNKPHTRGLMTYVVHGVAVHVTKANGGATINRVDESENAIWWCRLWKVDARAMMNAYKTGELVWTPKDANKKPFSWWWLD